MNKKLLILLAIAIVVIPLATACGRTAATGVTTLPAPKIPHPIDVRYENCNACHVADQLSANKPLPHTGMNYTNKDCISLACHEPETTTTTTTTPPPTTNTTTGTTTPTGGTSTTATTLPVLTDVAVPITNHTLAGLAAYKTVGCLFCHGPTGSYPQPYAGTWDGKASASLHNTGVYTITAGSKADHTGYTEATDCSAAGCHAAPTS